MLSLFQDAYRALPDISGDKEVWEQPPARVREEVQIMAAVAPLMFTDLSCAHSPVFKSSDASDSLGAITSADVGPAIHQEVWRHRDKRGHYTQLAQQHAAYLLARGLI